MKKIAEAKYNFKAIFFIFISEPLIQIGQIGQIIAICHGNGLNASGDHPVGEGDITAFPGVIHSGDTEHIYITIGLELQLIDGGGQLVIVGLQRRANEDLVIIIQDNHKDLIAELRDECLQSCICHSYFVTTFQREFEFFSVV